MFYNKADIVSMHGYTDIMNSMKKMNSEYCHLRSSTENKVGKSLLEFGIALKTMNFKKFNKKFKRWQNGIKSRKYIGTHRNVVNEYPQNYFSNYRIAVYTVVFGKYDKVLEPLIMPDNIDYFLITDQDIDLSKSAWKRVDISKFENKISDFDTVEKNRFFKMFPFLVFPNYSYSIYVDGNVQVITDLTEYIYHIGKYGLAAHMHSSRDCAYLEGKAILCAKKESKKNIDKHLQHLRDNGFPEHFGLLECNVLVRKNNEVCAKLMKMWWDEFMKYSHRDQLSLPFVLYLNGISIDQVGTLGNDVHQNYSFRIMAHE